MKTPNHQAPGSARLGVKESRALDKIMLRSMTVADVPAVLLLEREIFPQDAWSQELLTQELQQPRGHYVLAQWRQAPGAIMGYAGVFCLPPTADIQTLAVSPDYRNRGLGTLLFDSLLTFAAQQGSQECFLEVRADNSRAQELYRGRGFVYLRTRSRYYRDGTDAHVMRLQDLQSRRPQGEDDE